MIAKYKELYDLQQSSTPPSSSSSSRVEPEPKRRGQRAQTATAPSNNSVSEHCDVTSIKAGELAFMFWHDPALPMYTQCALPDHLLQGLRSCASNSGLQPVLLSYQKVSNVPSGTRILDCRELLSEGAFEQHLQHEVRG